MKVKSILILFFLIALLEGNQSWGCVGSRPLSMGGAFVGEASDVNATYWNPAGLAQIREYGEGTFMRIINNRKWINYNDYFAIVYPIDENSTLGISTIIVDHHYNWVYLEDELGNIVINDYLDYKNKWMILSFGSCFSGKNKEKNKTYYGLNVREYKEEVYFENTPTYVSYKYQDGTTEILDTRSYKESGYALDLALLHKFNEKFSIGVLAQDVNEPEAVFKHIKNIRPGISYRPNKNILITYDVYNAFPKEGFERDYRIGAEIFVNDSLAVRLGSYGDTFTTLGIGYKDNKKNWEIAYALLQDRQTEEETEDYKKSTHILSLVKKFF